jgi:hypothetical protein
LSIGAVSVCPTGPDGLATLLIVTNFRSAPHWRPRKRRRARAAYAT